MGKRIDLTGMAFGRLVVLSEKGRNAHKQLLWECQCECGKTVIVIGSNLRSGATTSCGCRAQEVSRMKACKAFKHHGKGTRLYRIWTGMKARCRDVSNQRYGGRGISVCQEWNNDFVAFRSWSIAHGYDETKSIDRIDPHGNYEPANCRWTDETTQQRNKTNNIKYAGVCLKEYALTHGLPYDAIRARIRKGWSIEDAVNKPLHHREPRRQLCPVPESAM